MSETREDFTKNEPDRSEPESDKEDSSSGNESDKNQKDSDNNKDSLPAKDPGDFFRSDNWFGRDIFHEKPSGFGFSEFRDLGIGSAFNRDANLENKKELLEGTWRLSTGEEATLSGGIHLITGLPSVKEVAIGVGLGAAAFFFGGEAAASG